MDTDRFADDADTVDDAAVVGDRLAGMAAEDEVAQEIRRRRLDAGWSQNGLAKRAGFARQYISRAENSTHGLPSENLVAILDTVLKAGGALVELRGVAATERRHRRENVLLGRGETRAVRTHAAQPTVLGPTADLANGASTGAVPSRPPLGQIDHPLVRRPSGTEGAEMVDLMDDRELVDLTPSRVELPGSCPPAPTQPSMASPVEGNDYDTEGGDPSVQRRDLLRAGSSLAISGLLASVVGGEPGGTSATSDVLDELTQRLVSLRKLDNTLGGADTYRLYAAEAELTAHLLRGSPLRDDMRRGLLALHAEQSQQAGWAAFDAGWNDAARDHYRRSHTAAMEAGDAGLAGNALAFHAYLLIGLGEPARSISVKSLHAADQSGVDPAVRALLYSRAAWTFALDGDADATARCLGHAEEAFTSAIGQVPDYAAWIDETELAIMTGRCWSELHRPLRAVPVLESALGRYSDAHSRDKALYSSWLADSYIDAGEIEQAATVVQFSLAVMGDVASVRPRKRLVAVAGRLAQHGDLPVVRDLLGRHPLHPLDVRR